MHITSKRLMDMAKLLDSINGTFGASVKCTFCKGNVGMITDPKVLKEYREHGLCEKCQGEISILWRSN